MITTFLVPIIVGFSTFAFIGGYAIVELINV